MLVDTIIPFLLVGTNCLAPLFLVKQDVASRQLQVSHDDRCTDATGGGIRIVLFPVVVALMTTCDDVIKY
jgi:hypothetical protein